MTFSYDLATNIGKLRLEIVDTIDETHIFSDEELQYFLDKAGDDIQWAKVFCYESRCAIESGLTGKEVEVGDIRIKGGSDVGKNFCQMAKELRYYLETGLGREATFFPYAYTGGIFQTDRDKLNQDIADGILIERDFYDYYNESGTRGGSLAEDDD